VTRSGPSPRREYTWTVSFLDDVQSIGDISELVVDDSNMENDASVTVTEIRKGTYQEQQTVRLSYANSADLGTIQLAFGALQTDDILVSDPATSCDGSSIKNALEALSTIGNVTVVCDFDANNYVEFAITFDTNAGDLDELSCATLNASGACTVTTIRDGTSEALGGTFTLEFEGQRTGYLPFDISANDMKTALELLDTVGEVDVSRSDADENYGYVWSVTFLTDLGNLNTMIADGRSLTGTVPIITIHEIDGTSPPFNSGVGGLALGSVTYVFSHTHTHHNSPSYTSLT